VTNPKPDERDVFDYEVPFFDTSGNTGFDDNTDFEEPLF
jgi:hypothetical protein